MKKTYKRYDEYKDSGIDWLGEVPKHWEVTKNKYVFQLYKEVVGKKANEFDLLSLTLKGIIKRDMENPQGKFPAEFDTYQKVQKGDLVFCLFDIEETPRTVGLSDYQGMITGAYTIYRCLENVYNRFIYYFYLNLDNNKRMKSLYTGLRNTISKDNFFAFTSFVPPLSEQQRIADFLDRRTSDIDKAIAQKEELIKLLNERKQILINRAVTRGLNENVPLKDSGVEWIGEIPEHWEVRKLKYICSMKSGETITALEFNDNSEFPVYGGNGYRGNTDKGYTHEGNYALMGRQGALCGNINYANGKFWASEHAVVITLLNRQSPVIWFGELLKAMNLNQYSISAAQPGLSVERILNLPTALPPLSEQQKISTWIEEQSTKIDQAITQKEEEITLLREYKSSLIDSAVRGQICLV